MEAERTYELVDLGLSALWADVNVKAGTPLGAATHLPTTHDFCELLEHCRWQRAVHGLTDGHRVTGPSGNSIFLPAGSYATLTVCESSWPPSPYPDGYYDDDDEDDDDYYRLNVAAGDAPGYGDTQAATFGYGPRGDAGLCLRPVRRLLTRRALSVSGDPAAPAPAAQLFKAQPPSAPQRADRHFSSAQEAYHAGLDKWYYLREKDEE